MSDSTLGDFQAAKQRARSRQGGGTLATALRLVTERDANLLTADEFHAAVAKLDSDGLDELRETMVATSLNYEEAQAVWAAKVAEFEAAFPA